MTKPRSFWPNSSGAVTLSGCSRHSSRPSERHHRLIGVGYSNGANILANLLFQNPSLVPAAVLMHPLIPFAPEDQPGLAGRRVLITAGEQDPICPPAMPRALHGYFERQRAAAEVVFHSGGHELQETELDAAQRFIATRPCFARRAAHPAGVRRLKSS
jgi:predicted esterase